MTKPGPKPRPKLRVLHGETRPSRVGPAKEPQPRNRRPTCPSHLSDGAKKAWRELMKELEPMGLAHSADQAILEVLSEAISQHREACRLVDTAGILIKGRDGGVVKNPACQIVRDTAATIGRHAPELGLTASGRTRLVSTSGEQDDVARKYLT